MIDIDTDRLQQMMSKLAQANSGIDNACETLLSITTHDGWACNERHMINEYILDNRKNIQNLQQRCSSFLSVAKTVADEFVSTEKGISNLFSGVEGALASILANPVASITIPAITIGTAAQKIFKRDWKSPIGSINIKKIFEGSFLVNRGYNGDSPIKTVDLRNLVV